MLTSKPILYVPCITWAHWKNEVTEGKKQCTGSVATVGHHDQGNEVTGKEEQGGRVEIVT